MIVFYLTNMVSGGSPAAQVANYVWAPVNVGGTNTWLAVSGWGTPTWVAQGGWGTPTWAPVNTSVT